MAKRILKDDIAERSVLDNLITPLRELIPMLMTASELLTSFAKQTKTALQFKTDAKGLREQDQLIRKINAAYEQKVKIDKEIVKQSKILADKEKENAKLYEKFAKDREKRAAQAEKQAKREQADHAKREAAYNREIKKEEELTKKTLADNEKKRLADIKLQQQREKSIDKFNKDEEKRLEKIAKDESRSLAERQKAEQSLQRQREKSLKDIAKAEEREKKNRQSAEQSLQKQRERGLREMERERVKAEELNRPYVQLDTTLKKLRKEYQDLAASGLSNTKRAKELRGEIGKLDTQMKKIDAETGVFNRNVGGYTETMKKGFMAARNAVAQLGLALGGIALARSAIATIVEFDSSIADLSAITGLAGKDLDFFKENAIRMGVDVKGGATAVVEAYKLIGSAKPELLENAAALNSVTESAILLSRASGMELPEAATALTDAMNQFGAGSDQAAKFVDVLAAGAKFGSAEIPQITEALLRFGAVAKTSNVNIQESTALIEDLAEKGLKGADAGTALRNVMLKLSAPDALPKEAQQRLEALGINFDTLRDKSLPFATRLEALKPLLKDNAALVKTFGTENAVAATTLISTTDRIKELTSQVDENGVALDQANARSKTLSEAWNRAKETLNGLVLEFANGSNAAGGLVSAIDFLRENIRTIISVLYQVIKAFVIFKGVMMALKLRESFRDWQALRNGIKDASGALKEGATSGSKFGAALKGIAFALAIDLAIELGTAIYRYASGLAAAEEQQNRLNKSIEEGSKKTDKYLSKRTESIDKQIRALEREARERIANGESEKKVNAELEQQKKKISDDEIKRERKIIKQLQEKRLANLEYRGQIRELSREYEAGRISGDKYAAKLVDIGEKLGANSMEFEHLKNNLTEGSFTNGDYFATQGLVDGMLQQTKANVEGLNKKISLHKKGISDLKEGYDEAETSIVEITKGTANNSKAVKANTTDIKDNNDELERRISLLNENLDLDQQIRQAQLDAAATDVGQFAADELAKQRVSATTTGVIDVDVLESILREQFNIRKRAIEEQAAFDREAVKNKIEDEYTLELQGLARKRDDLLAQDNLTASEREKILENYASAVADLNNKRVQSEAIAAKEIELINLNLKKSLRDLTDEESAELNRVNDELIQLQTDYWNEQARLADEARAEEERKKKEADDAEKARLERMQKFRNELIRMGTQYLTDQIDQQIAQQEKLSQESQKLQDLLIEKAKAGNISASESIVEQQRIQEEADRKKIELERRKANITAVSALLQSYNNKVSDGDKFALAETAVESGALLALLNSLPKFYSGTDTTLGAEKNPTKPGRDGHLIWADSEERIINPKLSRKIPKHVKNSDLVDGYLNSVQGQFSTGAMMYRESLGQDVAGNSFDIAPLLKSNQEIADAVRDIPGRQLTAEQVAQTMVKLTATTKTRSVTVKNQYIKRG